MRIIFQLINITNGLIICNDSILGCFVFCIGLKSITFPSSLRTIDEQAFWGCDGLKDITLPDSLTSIGNGAFAHCDSLTSIWIPSSIIRIGDEAFQWCEGLKRIYSGPRKPIYIGKMVFSGIDKTKCTLFVPFGSKSLYQAEDNWKDFQNIIETSFRKD